jgi:hypothetical protein
LMVEPSETFLSFTLQILTAAIAHDVTRTVTRRIQPICLRLPIIHLQGHFTGPFATKVTRQPSQALIPRH